MRAQHLIGAAMWSSFTRALYRVNLVPLQGFWSGVYFTCIFLACISCFFPTARHIAKKCQNTRVYFACIFQNGVYFLYRGIGADCTSDPPGPNTARLARLALARLRSTMSPKAKTIPEKGVQGKGGPGGQECKRAKADAAGHDASGAAERPRRCRNAADGEAEGEQSYEIKAIVDNLSSDPKARKAAYSKLGRALYKNGKVRDNVPPKVLARYNLVKNDERKKFNFLTEFMLDPSWGRMTLCVRLRFPRAQTIKECCAAWEACHFVWDL